MQTNLYNVSIPPLIKTLKAFSGIFDKTHSHASSKANERTPVEKHLETLLNERLVFDQFPFLRQIQIATDTAKGGAARLAQIEIPKYEDNEKTVEELKARIDKTIKFLESIKPEQIIGNEEIKIEMPYNQGKYLTGLEYVTEYHLPNFYFHITTAYSILRKNGVELGKMDYIGGLSFKDLA